MNVTDFPQTALEFERRFSSERSCREYLSQVKWPDGFVCPRCSCTKSYFVIERGLEECSDCGRQTSLIAGTMFQGTQKSLVMWFRAIFEFVSRKHGCNAMDLERLLGISYPTAWNWLHKIRDVFVRKEREPLKGAVEIDESYVGGPEAGVRGRDLGEKKILIVGAVEINGPHCGRVRLAPMPSADAGDLQPWVMKNVKWGATAETDGWGAYNSLAEIYGHNVTVTGKNPALASVHFPRIHRVFSLFKRVILGTYQGSWSRKWSALSCEEYTFRFNRQSSQSRMHLFKRVIEHAVRRKPRIHLFAGLKPPGQVLPEAA